MRRKRKIVFLVTLIILIFISIFFVKNYYKKINTGNNNFKQTLENTEEYIYNISSYEAIAEITVNSNKNTNKYLVKQKSSKTESMQEMLEPSNKKSKKMIYKDNTLTIENLALDLKKIYQEYPYIEENAVFLTDFINEYKIAQNKEIKENSEEIVYIIKTKKLYMMQKELYIDKKTGIPTKIVVQDNNKKTKIYILYKEIKLNN